MKLKDNSVLYPMSDYYFGTVGKENSWGLLADKPIVVWTREKGDFIAFDSIAEADKHFVSPSDQVVYFWDNGGWNKVDFLLEAGHPKVVKGFSPT